MARDEKERKASPVNGESGRKKKLGRIARYQLHHAVISKVIVRHDDNIYDANEPPMFAQNFVSLAMLWEREYENERRGGELTTVILAFTGIAPRNPRQARLPARQRDAGGNNQESSQHSDYPGPPGWELAQR